MGHSIGDGVIVIALSALFFGYLYLNYRTRMQRLQLVHQERLIAMDKDFPLPELPIDPPVNYRVRDSLPTLTIGIVLFAFSVGGMISLWFVLPDEAHRMWITPLPVALIGVGLMIVYRFMEHRGV